MSPALSWRSGDVREMPAWGHGEYDAAEEEEARGRWG